MKKLVEDYQFERVESIYVKGISYLVMQCDDFHGYPTTIGFVYETDQFSDGSGEISLAVKAAVCSKEDTFDPELGIDIVLGRLMRVESYDKSMFCKNLDAVDIPDFVAAQVEETGKRLARYLIHKNDAYSYIQQIKHSVNTDLAKRFEEFK